MSGSCCFLRPPFPTPPRPNAHTQSRLPAPRPLMSIPRRAPAGRPRSPHTDPGAARRRSSAEKTGRGARLGQVLGQGRPDDRSGRLTHRNAHFEALLIRAGHQKVPMEGLDLGRRIVHSSQSLVKRSGPIPSTSVPDTLQWSRQSHQHRKDFHCRSKLALEPIRSTDWDFPYSRMGSESSSERRWGCFCEQRMP